MTVDEIVQTLERWFPPALAEEWDNVGLLLGDRKLPASKVMTCLTVNDAVADEAIREQASLIVTHHPILFRPIQRLTADGSSGYVYRLARAGIAVYSPHTAFDGAAEGINQQIAERLGLADIEPLRAPVKEGVAGGAGRCGVLPAETTLEEFAKRVKAAVNSAAVQYVGSLSQSCRKVGIGCGAGGEFIRDARKAGCDVFVSGEARFHQLLETEAIGMGLVLAGHYATERFAVETLAERMGRTWGEVEVWASRDEKEPLTTILE